MSTRLFGRFCVISRLGAGSMGAVYHVRDLEKGGEAALKVLAPGKFPAEQRREIVRRFEREASVLARIDHPGIPRVLDSGAEESSRWIAMEMVEGETLAEWAKRQRGSGELRGRAVAIVAEAALAVHAAHAKGILHRDLKPENVMLEARTGRVRVLDFGLARETLHESRLTRDGQALGTPGYMAPEQCRGELDGVEARTDVWALGAILYELLVGTPPFAGSAPWKVALATLREVARPPRALDPSISLALERVCLRALAREKEERQPTAAAFAEELLAASPGAPAPRRRRSVLVAVGLGAVLVLGAALSLAAQRTSEAALAAPTPTRAAPAPAPRLDDGARAALLADVTRAWKERRYAEAVELSEAAFARSHDPWVEALAADACLEAGDPERALAKVKDWPPGAPGEARALSVRAFIHDARRDEDGRADCERATALDPSLARAWLVRSRVRLREALEAPDRTRESLLAEAATAARRASLEAPPCRGLASLARWQAERMLAISHGGVAPPFCDTDMALDPLGGQNHFRPPADSPVWASERGEVPFLQSAFERRYADPIAAEADARRAVAINPHRAFAHALLARFAAPDARAHLRTALELDRCEPFAEEWVISMHARLGAWDVADALLAARARRIPAVGCEAARAAIRALRGDLRGAVLGLDATIGTEADRWRHRSDCLKATLVALLAEDRDAATRFSRMVEAEYSDWGAAELIRSRVVLASGDPEGSLRLLERLEASGHATRHAAALHAAVARAWLAAGRSSEARAALARALAEDDAFASACLGAGIVVLAPDDPSAVRRALALFEAPDDVVCRTELREGWAVVGRIPLSWP